jgi:hypothetical protein
MYSHPFQRRLTGARAWAGLVAIFRAGLPFVCLLSAALPLVAQVRTKTEILDSLKGLGHGSYLFGQTATWVHGEKPEMDHPSNWLKRVSDRTDVLPAFGCLTYDFDNPRATDAQWNEGVKQMWDRGLLVGVYSFFANPTGGRWNAPAQMDPIFARDNNPVKTNFYRQMDRMATNLQWLKARGVVVIYTPFVELDDRYKWHAKGGATNGIRLYRLVHDHFTAKGLDNLIWAFHTTQRSGALPEYYPGDAYVDVIGKSAYGRGLVFDDYNWAVARKRQAGKVIWWAELGIRDKSEAPRDCLEVVKKLDERFPELAGFNFWGDEGHYNVVGNRNAKEFMTDPRIITLKNAKDRLQAAASKAK